MGLGRGGVTAAERALTASREALERETVEHAEHEAQLAEATRQRDALAEDPTSFAGNETKIAALAAEVRRRLIVIDRRSRDVEEAESKLEVALWEKAAAEHEAAVGRAIGEAKSFAAHLDRAASSARALAATREESDRLSARARELRPADVDEPLPADEPDFPGELGLVVEMIAAGPRQPHAAAEQARRAAEEQEARSEKTAIAQAVEDAIRPYRPPRSEAERQTLVNSVLGELPEHLREQARKLYEAELAALRQRQPRALARS